MDLGPAKQRAVLAALALEPNSLISTERLIEMVWGDAAPAAARKAVQVYVSHLRRILPAGQLVSRKPGYLLEVPPEAVDLHRFRALVAQARNADAGRARLLLAAAEQLWQGEPFDGLGDVPALANMAAGLLEERLSVTEWRLGLEVEQGRAAEVIAQLRALVVAHPLREPLHVLLMLALLRAGRPSEALAAYGDLRAVLAEELGIEPGPKATALHLRILRSETGRTPAEIDPAAVDEARAADPVAAFDPPVAPAQLPCDVVDFVGRTVEMASAERSLRDAHGCVPIVVLAGQPGVGKTALAVRLGHRMRAEFPDGQLFAELGGGRPVPAEPAEIAAAMLRALGVSAPAPSSLAERTAMLRSALAGRRVLMVLDDAADAAQVRPLLPGRAGSAVVVTSPRTLADLEGARTVRLDVLSDETSVELLCSLVGVERTAGAQETVRRIVAMCGNLPLGLRIAGARLASRPAWSLRHFADRLAHRGVLDELRVGDLGVRATFELSFARLDAEQARAIRLLAVPGWGDFCPLSAAALLGRRPQHAESLLEELLDIHLLRQPAPGRYGYHDLIGSFARQLGPETEERSSALVRLVGYHLHAVYRAVTLLVPGVRLDPPSVAPPPVLPDLPDHAAAVDWLHAEHVAVAAVAIEAVRARRAPLLDLAMLVVWLGNYVEIAGAWRGWRTLADEVLAAAEQSGERAAAAYARTALGGAAYRRGDIDGCLAHSQAALEYFRSVADHSRQARLHNLMAVALGDRGRHAEQKQHLYRAYDLHTLAGNVRSQAVVLANLGELHNATGRYATARRELKRAFDLVDAVRDPSFGLHCHYHLGCAHAGLGDDRLAEEQYHRALRLARQLGDHYLTGHTLRGLAALKRKSGDAGRAELLLREALRAYRTSRDRQEIAQTLAELAVLRDGVAVGTAFVKLGGLSA